MKSTAKKLKLHGQARGIHVYDQADGLPMERNPVPRTTIRPLTNPWSSGARIVLASALFFSALPAWAAETTIKGLVDKITQQVLQPIIYLLFALAFIIFIWGIIQYVIAQGGDKEKLTKAKQTIVWGIVGLFIMVSAWGIVQVLCNFFETCSGVEFRQPQNNNPGSIQL